MTYEAWAIEDFRGKQSGGPEVGLGIAEETMFTLQANGHEHAVALISSTGGSRARTSAWPVEGPVLGASVAASGLSSGGCCPNCGHDGRLLRMSPDFYPGVDAPSVSLSEYAEGVILPSEADAAVLASVLYACPPRDFYELTRAIVSESSSRDWLNSGSMHHGRFWTLSTSESRNAASACSLSQALEDDIPSKFYLSARAAAGILRRAERRGKELPTHLRQALEALATDTATHGTVTT